MIEFLLTILICMTLARIYQAHQHHKELLTWLDALGDMLADELQAILDTLKGKNK